MKKLTVAVLCIVLAAATALPVFAAEHVVCRINEIETSFDISTKWDYVTRSHITESFARSRNMTVARVAEYLDDLGMYLWLYAEKGDYELEVNSAPDERGGALDYAAMSEADFSAEQQRIVSAIQTGSGFSVGEIGEYRSSAVRYIRYTVTAGGAIYGVFFTTVCRGTDYSVIFRTLNATVPDYVSEDELAIADAIASALTTPEQHVPSLTDVSVPKEEDIITITLPGYVPETSVTAVTVTQAVTDVQGSVVTNAAGLPETEVVTNADGAAVTQTVTVTVAASGTQQGATDGQVNVKGSVWPAVIAAVAAAAAVCAVVIVVIRKKRG